MGWPVSHSRSPALHGFWLDRHAIDGAYVPLAVPPPRLEEALRALSALGFRGVNLTLPHKEAALLIADRVDPIARRIGAVNTIVVGDDGSLEAFNTDAYGFCQHLRETASGWQAEAAPAVVLGAGGGARGVLAALAEAGVREIRLVNRTRARAEAVAQALATEATHITVPSWGERSEALRGAGLLVNTTSLGMEGQSPLTLDLSPLPPDAVVADIVYVPLETPLLAAARRRGHRIVDGLGMLLHQGRPGFEAWFGKAVTVTAELRAAMLATLEPAA